MTPLILYENFSIFRSCENRLRKSGLFRNLKFMLEYKTYITMDTTLLFINQNQSKVFFHFLFFLNTSAKATATRRNGGHETGLDTVVDFIDHYYSMCSLAFY